MKVQDSEIEIILFLIGCMDTLILYPSVLMSVIDLNNSLSTKMSNENYACCEKMIIKLVSHDSGDH